MAPPSVRWTGEKEGKGGCNPLWVCQYSEVMNGYDVWGLKKKDKIP